MGCSAHRTAIVLLLACALSAPAAFAAPPGQAAKGNAKASAKGNGGKPPAASAAGLSWAGGPPPWAPAHGYRRKQGAPAVYEQPYGILSGTCDRTLLGAALGGAAGGLIAAGAADGEHRTEAIIGGTLLGILVGGAIGYAMDDLDQHCVGQILEHGAPSQSVHWINPKNGADYVVKPLRTWDDGDGRFCREYETTVTVGGKAQHDLGTACRAPDGSWQRRS